MNGWSAVVAYTRAGGPVMIPLVIVSLVMWYLIFLKCFWLLQVRRHPMKISEALALMDVQDNHLAAVESPEGSRRSALAYFLVRRSRDPEPDRILWDASIRRQMFRMNRYLAGIRIFGAVAPLLGLLGTVNGMVATFQVIGFQGTGNSQALASGIKEALITTQTGLLVAIPGLLAAQVLAKRVRDMKGDLMVFHRAIEQHIDISTGTLNPTAITG